MIPIEGYVVGIKRHEATDTGLIHKTVLFGKSTPGHGKGYELPYQKFTENGLTPFTDLAEAVKIYQDMHQRLLAEMKRPAPVMTGANLSEIKMQIATNYDEEEGFRPDESSTQGLVIVRTVDDFGLSAIYGIPKAGVPNEFRSATNIEYRTSPFYYFDPAIRALAELRGSHSHTSALASFYTREVKPPRFNLSN
jgi:hypothetical protein